MRHSIDADIANALHAQYMFRIMNLTAGLDDNSHRDVSPAGPNNRR